MQRWHHHTEVSVVLAAALLSACGGAPPDRNVMSCKVTEGSHAVCLEYVQPRSDDLRLAIFAQCREGGGVITDACPTDNLVGTCERATDPRKPTTLSDKMRMKTYFQPGGLNPPDANRLREQCEVGAGTWTQPPSGGDSA